MCSSAAHGPAANDAHIALDYLSIRSHGVEDRPEGTVGKPMYSLGLLDGGGSNPVERCRLAVVELYGAEIE